MQKTKTDRLKELLSQSRGANTSQNLGENLDFLPPLTRVSERRYYPLSSAQKRLFILNELVSDQIVYNLPFALKIKGKLDIDKLQNAFHYIVKRHDALRSTFELVNGTPVQIIHEEINWQLTYHLDPHFDLIKELNRWVKPFDLKLGPLFRIEWIEIDDQTSILLFDMHHIIADARSFSILIEELMVALYSDSPLTPLNINYRDYAVWQNELLTSSQLLKQKDYWIKQFSHPLPILRLPTDFPLSGPTSFMGERLFFLLDNPATTFLRSLAKESKTSLYMMLLSVYATLLHRYTLDEEIIIGSSIEGRPEHNLRNIMGVFINILPIKCQPHSDKTFKSLLFEIKQTCLNAFQNQLFPFEELAKIIAPHRNLNHNPIFQTLFDFHKASRARIDLKNLSLEYLRIQHKTSKFDLSLEVTEHEDHLELFFEFNTDLFKRETIQSLAESFLNIIQHIRQNSNFRIGQIPLFTKERQAEIFSLFDSVDLAIPHYTSFQNLFKKHVLSFPNKIAAEDDCLYITYAQLDKVSTHLSHQLRKMGVLPNDVVATCMERSIDLLVCMLAIFKSGAAYLPIDPEYPLSRANAILKESRSKILLSNTDAKSKQDYLLNPINIQSLISSPTPSLPTLDVPPDMLAYLIFTSGSTGNPKGAMLTHRGMINHIYSKIETLGLTEHDVIAQTSSQTFDVSIWQFLTLLLVGGKVVIFNQENAWSPSLLLKELERKKITIFETVPSHMHLVLDVLDEHFLLLSHLRYLILNGEALPVKVCAKWQKYYPSIPIVNAYGPTECSDDVCHHLVKEQDMNEKETLPIGRMISNLKGYILNSSLSLMPPHVPGEFYLGGVGLARGYVGQPDLTAEVFIPSPFEQKGQRLYRTKDLAQYTLDGNIHYLGRVDRQVKIQGVRIELEEIESVLKKHPLVQQAVVLIKKDFTFKEFLVAYVIPEKDKENHENLTVDLLRYLKQKLPVAMIPHTWMYLQNFPLNSNGKINTKALPDPLQSDSTKQDFISPETQTEKQLSALWERILKVSPIGKQDHFFEKGGNSLLAIQYATEIRQLFAIEMPLYEVFSRPTLSEQAAYIDEQQKIGLFVQEDLQALPLIKADLPARYESFPLTGVQHAYWLGRSGIFELGDVSVHVYTEYEKKGLNLDLLERALNKLIERHEALRLIFSLDGTQQILEKVPDYRIKFTDLSRETQKEIEEWTAEKRHQLSHEIFPSNVWPLFSVEAVQLPYNKVRLYLSFDALILDGWSINTLFLEWKKWYEDIDTVFTPLDLSFRDYVLTLKQIQNTPLYQRDRNYWLSRIETFPLAPPLPLVSSSTSIKTQKFSRCTYRLPKTLWNKCQQHLKMLGLSPTAFIAAVFAEVLAKYSGAEHFTLNLTLFDRLPLHPQINEIAGDFTSIILLEVDRKELLFESFLKRAKALQKQLWQDLDHHLYSGIEFLRELSRHYKELPLGSLMPVVLTSILGVEDNDYDIQQFLGKEIFGISQTPQVWLDYKAYEVEGDLVVEWDYVSELFSPGFITSMHTSYCNLLTDLATHDNLWQEQVSSLLSNQQQVFWDSYNKTSWSVDYETMPSLIYQNLDLFLKNAAVISQEGVLTYEALDQASNQIGHHLLSHGVKPNQLIAVIMEKGWEQVIACLGILKAGAAYLPIDPHHPPLRIEELLQLGKISYILTQDKWLNKLETISTFLNLPKENVISSLQQVSHCSKDRLISPAKLTDLMYVIFTSGSTGKPKGVMIEHQGVVNTILDLNERFDLQSTDRVISLSNLNFDLSVFDLFGLLIVKGAVVFPDPDKIKEPSHWVDLILTHGVTIWNTVPMFMSILVEYLENADQETIHKLFGTLRLVFLSGDWIPIDLPKRIQRLFGQSNHHLKIVSLGGATEASIWSIAYEINPHHTFEKSIPYGFPLRNQKFYVLNDQLELAPERVTGHLYIGGIGVARGYWRDQEKTQQSFLHHPKWGFLYKTGDLGRFHQENGIEFLGRQDFQVKIGGHRIELGEIESILNQHQEVQQSVVLVLDDHSRIKKLSASIVFKKPEISENHASNFSVIQDSQDRMAFTLAQHGRRKFPHYVSKTAAGFISKELEKQNYQRKSFRRFERKNLENEELLHWLQESFTLKKARTISSEHVFSAQGLSSILRVLGGISHTSQPLPKFRYPSAGSLYPIQTYLSLPAAIPGIESGIYYYDPILNDLVYLSPSSKSETDHRLLTLYFVAKYPAIEPLYGSLSHDFCLLEAGYMMHLIQTSCEMQGLRCNILETDQINSSIERFLQLGEKEKLISEFVITQEQHHSEIFKLPLLYLYVKEGAIVNLREGWYLYDSSKFSLKKQDVVDGIDIPPVFMDTYSIFHEAACALFFAIPNQAQPTLRKQFLLQTGSLSQSLMEQGIEDQIGICPIGQLDHRNKTIIDRVTDHQEIAHILFMGGISQEQIEAKEPSKIQEGCFEKNLNNYLKSRLPHYMIPNSFTFLERIPLTINGKIDQKALINLVATAPIRSKEVSVARNDIEAKLLEIWREVLQVSEIGIHDHFFELGGQSLLMTQMALKVRGHFNIDVPLRTFFELTTISDLAEFLNQSIQVNKNKANSFQEDAMLDPNIRFTLPKNPLIHHPQAILLTGATGFLGIHILQNLLQNTNAKIYCLIRAKDDQQAKEKLAASLERYQIQLADMMDRLEYVLGDLSHPQLGCSPERYQELCQVIDIVYHNGAYVHHVYDYKMLKNSNVLSTVEVIKLATLQKEKAIFYVSTLVAANDSDEKGELKEDFPNDPPDSMISGYQQTKWISEKLLFEAHQRHLPVMIFRPSTITGHEKTGICSFENDHFLRLIKGCIQLGYAPLSEEWIDLLPVNFVSQFIVTASLRSEAMGKIFNLTSPYKIRWSELIEWLNRAGFAMQLIPPKKWKNLLLDITPDNSLFPLLSIYLSEEIEHSYRIAKNQNVVTLF